MNATHSTRTRILQWFLAAAPAVGLVVVAGCGEPETASGQPAEAAEEVIAGDEGQPAQPPRPVGQPAQPPRPVGQPAQPPRPEGQPGPDGGGPQPGPGGGQPHPTPGVEPVTVLHRHLQAVRSQLELYKVQHLDTYPGIGPDGRLDEAMFVRQIIGMTNARGEVRPEDATGSDYPYGPYLQQIPANPFVSGIEASQVKLGRGACPGDGTTGWYFDADTGKFCANDPEHKDR